MNSSTSLAPSLQDISIAPSLLDLSNLLEQWIDSHEIDFNNSEDVDKAGHKYSLLLKTLRYSEALNTLFVPSKQRDDLYFSINYSLSWLEPMPLDPHQARRTLGDSISYLRSLIQEMRQSSHAKALVYP